eukprot:4575171-Ditylum_brightwellii.AAC.1
MNEALKDEIRRTMEEEMKDWENVPPEKRGNKPMTYAEWLKTPEEERPPVKITASFDTGWQRR